MFVPFSEYSTVTDVPLSSTNVNLTSPATPRRRAAVRDPDVARVARERRGERLVGEPGHRSASGDGRRSERAGCARGDGWGDGRGGGQPEAVVRRCRGPRQALGLLELLVGEERRSGGLITFLDPVDADRHDSRERDERERDDDRSDQDLDDREPALVGDAALARVTHGIVMRPGKLTVTVCVASSIGFCTV